MTELILPHFEFTFGSVSIMAASSIVILRAVSKDLPEQISGSTSKRHFIPISNSKGSTAAAVSFSPEQAVQINGPASI
jgi:hypothetical protein